MKSPTAVPNSKLQNSDCNNHGNTHEKLTIIIIIVNSGKIVVIIVAIVIIIVIMLILLGRFGCLELRDLGLLHFRPDFSGSGPISSLGPTPSNPKLGILLVGS